MGMRDTGMTVDQFINKAFWIIISGIISFTSLRVANTFDELKKDTREVKDMVFDVRRILAGIGSRIDGQETRLEGHDRLLNTLYKFEFKKNLENKPIHKED